MGLHTRDDSATWAEVSVPELLAALESIGVSVALTDLTGTVLAWSDSATALFGWPAADALGARLADLTPWALSRSGGDGRLNPASLPFSGEADVVTSDAGVVRVRVCAALVGDDEDLVLSLARPVGAAGSEPVRRVPVDGGGAGERAGEASSHDDELLRLALHDRLTGLPNRLHLTQRLHRWRNDPGHEGSALAVLFVDVDRFKLVNDNMGHAAGDALLVSVAHRLSVSCRPCDMVARVGDDEFVVARVGADAEQARELAEQVSRAFDDPCSAGESPIPVSISIGIATTDEVPVGELLQAAERALAWAKAGGSQRIATHTPSMRDYTEGQLELLTDLRTAIRGGGLALHYQPIVRADGRVAGVEALLRWTRPRHGPVSPADLIRLAEDNGLMPELGAWIVNRACLDIAGNPHARAAGLYVAVNLSTRQLANPDIVETVAGALRCARLPAERLILEVTETSVIANADTTSRHLHALKDLGVRLALDDFGTGYSSLAYVRRFPVDILKIDRGFIAGMSTNNEDFAIVASLTHLAGAVGLDVVAEGVETPEQAEILRRLGCTYTQGYLWSPAVPLADLAEVLRKDGSYAARPESPPRRRSSTVVTTDDHENLGRVLALHRAGASLHTIAAVLNADGRRTPQGSRWQATSVARLIADGSP